MLFAIIASLIAGGAIVWFTKDTLMKWVLGAEAFAKSLETKAAAVKAAV